MSENVYQNAHCLLPAARFSLLATVTLSHMQKNWLMSRRQASFRFTFKSVVTFRALPPLVAGSSVPAGERRRRNTWKKTAINGMLFSLKSLLTKERRVAGGAA
jgi:hypothetical protein